MTSNSGVFAWTKPPRPFGFRMSLAGALIGGLIALLAAGTVSAAPGTCDAGATAAAARNAASLTTLAWSPFGRAETGWSIYEPLIAREIGTDCPAGSAGFAAALAKWQGARGAPARGVMDAATFARLKSLWQSRRPFVAASRAACPAAPSEGSLSQAAAIESYGGKTILLTPGALAAYRQMLAAARAEIPAARFNPQLLTIFSGFRSPDYDAARCARDRNCQGVVRASCSAHRTATALDLNLGAAPGYGPDSSADPNRLFQTHTAAYRWLLANGRRFGFVNYAFEPWHWEWVGAPR